MKTVVVISKDSFPIRKEKIKIYENTRKKINIQGI